MVEKYIFSLPNVDEPQPKRKNLTTDFTDGSGFVHKSVKNLCGSFGAMVNFFP